MKKAFATILALLYLASSIGATVNVHYCMGRVFKVDMAGADDCVKCGMKSDSRGCCKNEVKLIKVTDSHQAAAADIQLAVSVAILHQQFPETGSSLQVLAPVTTHNNSPPLLPSRSLCILNCVFRL